MNLSNAAIFALALHHSASAEFNHLRAVSRGGRSRALQACDAITWSKSCRETSGCAWSGGNCVSTGPPPGPTPPPPSPSPPTDPLPTSQPTPLPTFMPVPAGAGYCSDGSGQCYATSECACGGGGGASSTVFKRHLQDCGSATKSKDCPSPCVWTNGPNGGCSNPQTSAPTNKVS